MEDVNDRLKLKNVPEPWKHFDLICGSGFGGLLAIMLGRLHMVRLRKYLDPKMDPDLTFQYRALMRVKSGLRKGSLASLQTIQDGDHGVHQVVKNAHPRSKKPSKT